MYIYIYIWPNFFSLLQKRDPNCRYFDSIWSISGTQICPQNDPPKWSPNDPAALWPKIALQNRCLRGPQGGLRHSVRTQSGPRGL